MTPLNVPVVEILSLADSKNTLCLRCSDGAMRGPIFSPFRILSILDLTQWHRPRRGHRQQQIQHRRHPQKEKCVAFLRDPIDPCHRARTFSAAIDRAITVAVRSAAHSYDRSVPARRCSRTNGALCITKHHVLILWLTQLSFSLTTANSYLCSRTSGC